MADLGSLGERLDALRETRGEGISAFAETLGISRTTLYEWRLADEPTQKAIGVVVSSFPNVNVHWLNTGEGQMLSVSQYEIRASEPEVGYEEEKPTPPEGEAGDRYGEATLYGDVSAENGEAMLLLNEPATIRVTHSRWRRDFGDDVPFNAQGFGYWRVNGDSAAPHYFDGENVPVEEAPRGQEFRSENIYVFAWRGHAYLKRLFKSDGGVYGQSLNPSVRDMEFKPEGEHDFAVLARVRQSMKQQLFVSLLGSKLEPNR